MMRNNTTRSCLMAVVISCALASSASAQDAQPNTATATAILERYQPTATETEAFKQRVYDAIASHPRVRSAFARTGQAAADTNMARAALRPQLSMEVQGRTSLARDFGNDFDDLVDRSQSDDDARASLVARQLIFDGGAASGRLRAARLLEHKAEARAEAEINQFALTAITTYYNVVRYRMVRDLAHSNVTRHQELLSDIEARLSQGVGDARSVARGQARLADARAQLISVERQLEAANNNYVEFFGMMPDNVSLPQAPFAQLPSREDAQQTAISRSPALAAAISEQDARKAEYRAARTEKFIPSLSVELRGTRYNIGESGEDYDLSAILAVNYSLYSGGLKSARENRALQHMRETQFNAEAMQREIIRRVHTAHQQVTSWAGELVLLKTAAVSNAQSREIFLEQFSVAGGSVLDVFQAEQDYVSAAKRYIDGSVEYALSAYALLGETGQLLHSFDFYLTDYGTEPYTN